MKIFVSVAAAMLLILAGVTQPAFAQVPPGSWQQSCQNVQIHGTIVNADCQTGHGYQHSSIDSSRCPGGSLQNRNGTLTCQVRGGQFETNLPTGSWQSSCQNARVRNGVLHAQCSTGHGYNRTTYTLSTCYSGSLSNVNGNLQCDTRGYNRGGYNRGNNSWRNANMSGFPGGSWSASCSNPTMNGRMFTASCRSDNGSYRTSTLDVSRCSGQTVANRNGQLECAQYR